MSKKKAVIRRARPAKKAAIKRARPVKEVALPVAPRLKQLPFHAPEFTWETFEGFFCDFLAAGPTLKDKNGDDCKVVFAPLYGQRGESQYGIDIEAEMSNGEIWAFQCKHYKQWPVQKTKAAIADCTYIADRKFLLVTRGVSTESRDEIDKHDDWELWDADDISRQFLSRLSEGNAARILYSNFGPSWPREMLGCDGYSALISPEAHYSKFLELGRNFHHRLSLVARNDYITELDAFVKAPSARVCFLVGRGGSGKSRILLEWSRKFASRNHGHTLKFASNAPRNFSESIEICDKPLVIVVDDAHRFPEVRKAVFGEASNRTDIKVVVSLRPGPLAQTRGELIDFGFETNEIIDTPSIEPLDPLDCLKLVEEALGPELAERYKVQLWKLAQDCPLLGVLAAELIKRGELDSKSLSDTDEIKARVFDGLLRDAEAIEGNFQSGVVRDFMRLISLLGPVKIDAKFREAAVKFLTKGVLPNQIDDIASGLEDVGLTVTSGAGIRVTPDLLSDHLAYGACYNKSGSNSTFSDRVLECFSDDVFPTLLQSLSEAEWRAQNAHPNPDSVVEPLWLKYEEAFKGGSFYRRCKLIEEWANVAHLQPKRTLALSLLGVQLKDAPKDEYCWHEGLDSYGRVLETVPKILKPLAQSHPDSVETCLGILWDLGKGQPKHPLQNQNHPIQIIGEIVSYDHGCFPDIQERGLVWMERLFNDDRWLLGVIDPVWAFASMLKPFFATTVEQTRLFGNLVQWCQRPVNLNATDTFRSRIRGLCSRLLSLQSVWCSLCALEVMEAGVRYHYSPSVDPGSDWSQKWQSERSHALEVVRVAVDAFPDSLIHFRIYKLVTNGIRRKADSLDGALVGVSESLTASLKFNLYCILMRANVGIQDLLELKGEITADGDSDEYWAGLCRSTVDHLIVDYPDVESLSEFICMVYLKAQEYGYSPHLPNLFSHLSKRHPEHALELARYLVGTPEDELSVAYSSLIFDATEGAEDLREELCCLALKTEADVLTVEVVECLRRWRDSQNGLSIKARKKIMELADTASTRISAALIHFVYFSRDNFIEDDWRLLSGIPVTTDSADTKQFLFECVVRLINEEHRPSRGTLERLLEHLLIPFPLDELITNDDLSFLAREYPVEIFMMFHSRVVKLDNELRAAQALTDNFDSLRLRSLLKDPKAANLITTFEVRLFSEEKMPEHELSLFWAAIMHDGSATEGFLLEILGNAKTESHIERLVSFLQWDDSIAVILEYSNLTREILLKARALKWRVYSKVFNTLQEIPGSRGFSGGAPNCEWEALIKKLEACASEHVADLELGPLYSRTLQKEKDWVASMRSHKYE